MGREVLHGEVRLLHPSHDVRDVVGDQGLPKLHPEIPEGILPFRPGSPGGIEAPLQEVGLLGGDETGGGVVEAPGKGALRWPLGEGPAEVAELPRGEGGGKVGVEEGQPLVPLVLRPTAAPALAVEGFPRSVEPLVGDPIPKLQDREGGVVAETALEGGCVVDPVEVELRLSGTADDQGKGRRKRGRLLLQVSEGPEGLGPEVLPQPPRVPGGGGEDIFVRGGSRPELSLGGQPVVVVPLGVSQIFLLGRVVEARRPGHSEEESHVEPHPLGESLGAQLVHGVPEDGHGGRVGLALRAPGEVEGVEVGEVEGGVDPLPEEALDGGDLLGGAVQGVGHGEEKPVLRGGPG